MEREVEDLLRHLRMPGPGLVQRLLLWIGKLTDDTLGFLGKYVGPFTLIGSATVLAYSAISSNATVETLAIAMLFIWGFWWLILKASSSD